MFNRHQAEITVMQFRGHSLPVHLSMSVSWAFTLSHFVSQIRLRDFFRLLAIGLHPFFPVHHFGMACLVGSKVNIQQFFDKVCLKSSKTFCRETWRNVDFLRFIVLSGLSNIEQCGVPSCLRAGCLAFVPGGCVCKVWYPDLKGLPPSLCLFARLSLLLGV